MSSAALVTQPSHAGIVFHTSWLKSIAENIRADRQPATLGRSARRRGGEASRQRAAMTATAPSDAAMQRMYCTSPIVSATDMSPWTTSRLPG